MSTWRTSHLIGTSLASNIATLCGEHKKMMMNFFDSMQIVAGMHSVNLNDMKSPGYRVPWFVKVTQTSCELDDWDREYTSNLRAREQKMIKDVQIKSDSWYCIWFSHFVARFGWPSNPNPFCQSGNLVRRDSATGLIFIFPVLGKWANDVWDSWAMCDLF